MVLEVRLWDGIARVQIIGYLCLTGKGRGGLCREQERDNLVRVFQSFDSWWCSVDVNMRVIIHGEGMFGEGAQATGVRVRDLCSVIVSVYPRVSIHAGPLFAGDTSA